MTKEARDIKHRRMSYDEALERKYIDLDKIKDGEKRYLGCAVYSLKFRHYFTYINGKEQEAKLLKSDYDNIITSFCNENKDIEQHIIRDYIHTRPIEYIGDNIDFQHNAKQTLFPEINGTDVDTTNR